MNIEQLLDWLDGYGIVFEDEELVEEKLNFYGLSLDSVVVISKEEPRTFPQE